jgi:hypothetical protein
VTGTSPWPARMLAATLAGGVHPLGVKPSSYQLALPLPGGVLTPLPPFPQTWMFPESVERSMVCPLEQLICMAQAANMTAAWVFWLSTAMTLLLPPAINALMSAGLVLVIQETALVPWANPKEPMETLST